MLVPMTPPPMTIARAWSGIDPFAAACASTTVTPSSADAGRHAGGLAAPVRRS